jgi:ribonuclease D
MPKMPKILRNMFQTTITKEEIRQLPKKSFEGKIILIDNYHSFKRYIPVIQAEKLWGFDTETRPAFRKGTFNKPALIQFANEAYAFLFRLNRIGLPAELVDVIEDPGIIKIGVALHEDLKDLGMYRKTKPAGFVDLQKFVGQFGIESKGLDKLTAIILKFRISKSQQVTDWEKKILAPQQLIYAATDAWVCYKIYKALQRIKPK